MGYVFFESNGQRYSGELNDAVFSNEASSFNFFSVEEQTIYSSNVPFSIILTSADPNSSVPYRLCLVSPHHYLYFELDQQEFLQNTLNRGLHRHNTYEIVYTRYGEFYQQIEARRYKYTPRTCCLLNRNIRHREEYTTAFSTVNISLSAELMRELLADKSDKWFSEDFVDWQKTDEFRRFIDAEFHGPGIQRKSCINFTPNSPYAEKDEIHDLFDQLAALIITPVPGGSFHLRGIIRNILFLLCDKTRYSTELMSLGTETEDSVYARVTQEMEASYGKITRSELSKKLNYSGNYLNRIVKKYTGMTLSQYGNHFSMQHAAFLLARTEKTISQIIADLGFSDRTHFYRLFEAEYGETPRQFQKKYRQ